MARDDRSSPCPDSDIENELHTASPTAYLLDELALYGHRPGQDEPDPRPLPEPDAVQGQVDNAVEALSAMLTGTRLEDDLDDLLWSFAEDARYDGLYVLRTNTKLTPLQVMRRYRDLLRVEQLFRQAKAVLATRPIYHSSDMAIRGHVFCSFLAFLLAKELEERLHRHDIAAEWGDIRRDLDRLQEIELEQDGKRFLLRTPTTGVAGKLFQAVGVALPPNFQELPCRPRSQQPKNPAPAPPLWC